MSLWSILDALCSFLEICFSQEILQSEEEDVLVRNGSRAGAGGVQWRLLKVMHDSVLDWGQEDDEGSLAAGESDIKCSAVHLAFLSPTKICVMNQFYGSERLGKRRLAELAKTEKEAIQNPLLGRSRAERLLDDSLISLKRARNEVVDPLTGRECGTASNKVSSVSSVSLSESRLLSKDKQGRVHIRGACEPVPPTAPIIASTKPVRTPAAPQPAFLDLLHVLHRLELRPKFPRSIQLLHRFFSKGDGKAMLDAWRHAVEAGFGQPSANEKSVIREAADHKAWLVFYVAWKISLCSHVCNSGDAREMILRLFDEVFVRDGESSVQAAAPPSFKTHTAAGGSEILQGTYTHLVTEQDIDASKEVNSNGSLIRCGLSGCTVRDRDEGLDKPFFTESWHWAWFYTYLMPVCRISALSHNLLFTDDPHIFHKGLRYIQAVFETVPFSYGSIREKLRMPANEEEAAGTGRDLVWTVPNGRELLVMRKKLMFDALPTALKHRTQGWARTSVEQFFQSMYSQRFAKFDDHEIEMIEVWQSQVKEAARESTTTRPRPEDQWVEPGQSHVAVRDAREEIISTVHGTQVWSDKQMV